MSDFPFPFSWEGRLPGRLAPVVVAVTPARTSRVAMPAMGAIGAALLLLTVATVYLCGGHFVYCLDDPYITLALSLHIAEGHYGLNAVEAASPSSSILLPFLLMPFARFSWQELVPLIVNSAAAVGTVVLFAASCSRYGIGAQPQARLRIAFLLVVLCFSINLVGLVFTGLEHSLHTLTSVAIVYGLARTLEGDEMPVWLVPVLVLNPLWRFEGTALTFATLAALAVSGHLRAAAAGFVLSSAALGGYMLLMSSLGLPLLPSSVMVKEATRASTDSTLGLILDLVHNAGSAVISYTPHILLLWLSVALLILHPFLRSRGALTRISNRQMSLRREVLLAAVVLAAAGAHMLVGRWGSWFRYEIYLMAMTIPAVIVLWHAHLDAFIRRARFRFILLAGGAILCLGIFYLRGTVLGPLGSRSIYEEQYQMHRFATDFYRRPVAVNDLGWVSYRNPNYVLDLWGLGSEDARIARLVTHRPGWMDQLTHRHNVGLAMIYPSWFSGEIPASWHQIATLRNAHSTVTALSSDVAVYATAPEAEADALTALHRFAAATPVTDTSVIFTF
jgi:hypothetical protein